MPNTNDKYTKPLPHKKIINLGILAHVDAGKTTVTEQMLFLSGQLRSAGRVDDGTTQTDNLPVEQERGISVRAATAALSWQGTQVNIIDTPGHVDFAGETERSLLALDTAVLVISSAEGIQSHTETLYRALEAMKIPTIVFINKVDRMSSSFDSVVAELRKQFGCRCVTINRPIHEGSDNCQVIPLPLTDDNNLAAIAEAHEEIAELYLSDIIPEENKLTQALAEAVKLRQVIPVVCGAAISGKGISQLLDTIVAFLPAAQTKDTELSGIVFKVEHDKQLGKGAHVRLFGGGIKNRDEVFIQSADTAEKVTRIRQAVGRKRIDINSVEAGDIAILYGLPSIKTGSVIGRTILEKYNSGIAVPLLKSQLVPQKEEDLANLVEAVGQLTDEDPLLDMEWLPDERELHVKIMGVIQTEVLEKILLERYGLAVGFMSPTVIYKETPSSVGEGFEAYTMPKPCWAVVKLLFEPMNRGYGFSFESRVNGTQMLFRYQNHIAECLPRALKQGLYGWEVTDLKVTLIDGEHHLIHTHPLDFFVATPMAVMNGLKQTGSTLLEPMTLVRISADEDTLGKVIGDIISMRGSFDSPVIHNNAFTLEARLPVATSLDYPVRLAILTAGRGVITSRFDGYEECPIELGKTAKRRGVDPSDKPKWILHCRNAL